MEEKILLKKTCSIYASNMHLATMIFPFISKEMKNDITIKTILENEIEKDIKIVVDSTNIDSELKEKIIKIDWTQTNVEKIKKILKSIEKELDKKDKANIIISGSNYFINKVNEVIDLWVKSNLDEIEKSHKVINVINCYCFEENNELDEIIQKHEYILKTSGIEEIYGKELLKKAN